MELVWQGVDLMVAGMVTVFGFLTLLVLATAAMSRLLRRWLPPAVVPTPARQGTAIDAETVAAVTAAIARHRSRS
jgi:oxaloacetate decarboxylase (Na+ extruding) subunit gamma